MFKRLIRAFTLVELLVVIILVAVLAGIAVQRISNSALLSKEASLRANLKLIREAGDRCEADTGLTVGVHHLASRTAPSSGYLRGAMNSTWPSVALIASTWKGPYLLAVPRNEFTGNNTYSVGITESTTVAWTHESRQSYNSSYYSFPSTAIGSNGKPYREW